MRSVAGVALIAPARGRASKKIINIMHAGACALFLEAKVAVGKNKATKTIDNWKGSVQRKVLGRAAGQSLPENPNRSTHSWESKWAPNFRRFS